MCPTADASSVLGANTPASCFTTVATTSVPDAATTCSNLLFGGGTFVQLDSSAGAPFVLTVGAATSIATVSPGLVCLFGKIMSILNPLIP